MGINKPIIAAESARRTKLKTTVLRVTNIAPPDPTFGPEVDGVRTIIIQTPVREGQMVLYREPGLSPYMEMYVTVDVGGGVLEWRPVITNSQIFNNATGRLWDSNAAFYTVLAR